MPGIVRANIAEIQRKKDEKRGKSERSPVGISTHRPQSLLLEVLQHNQAASKSIAHKPHTRCWLKPKGSGWFPFPPEVPMRQNHGSNHTTDLTHGPNPRVHDATRPARRLSPSLLQKREAQA